MASGSGIRTVIGGGRTDLLRARLAEALLQDARAVMSFGIAGGLSPALEPGDCVIASEIVGKDRRYATDAAWSANLAALLPGARSGSIAGTDTMLTEPAQKAALYRLTGAIAADMESHIAAELAAKHDLPFTALRIVSDAADRALPPAVLGALKENGETNLGAVLWSVLGHPAQIPALIRTGREAEYAFRALLRCRDSLGPRLGAVDFVELALDMR